MSYKKVHKFLNY